MRPWSSLFYIQRSMRLSIAVCSYNIANVHRAEHALMLSEPPASHFFETDEKTANRGHRSHVQSCSPAGCGKMSVSHNCAQPATNPTAWPQEANKSTCRRWRSRHCYRIGSLKPVAKPHLTSRIHFRTAQRSGRGGVVVSAFNAKVITVKIEV